jgi:hypothetical protein
MRPQLFSCKLVVSECLRAESDHRCETVVNIAVERSCDDHQGPQIAFLNMRWQKTRPTGCGRTGFHPSKQLAGDLEFCGEPTLHSLKRSEWGDRSSCASLVGSAHFSADCQAAISQQTIPRQGTANCIALMKGNQRSLGERDFGWFFLRGKRAVAEVWRCFWKAPYRRAVAG